MKIYYNLLLLISVLLCLALYVQSDQQQQNNNNNDIFLPTHEWKEVSSTQSLPPGLHIRVDMNTGQRYARIHDINDSNNIQHTTDIVMVEQQQDDITQQQRNVVDNTYTTLDYTNYELSDDSDEYTLNQLLSIVVSPHASHDIVYNALELLDDKVSDIDAAEHFININGLLPIITLLDTQYNNDNILTQYELNNLYNLQLQSIKLISSLAQNNPYAKTYLHQKQYIDNVLQYIKIDKLNSLDNTDTQVQLLNRALTCLHIMTDNSIDLQNDFINHNGWSHLYNLHNYVGRLQSHNNTTQHNKLVSRLLRLQHDLLMNTSSSTGSIRTQHNQWCINNVLSSSVYDSARESANQLQALYDSRCAVYK